MSATFIQKSGEAPPPSRTCSAPPPRYQNNECQAPRCRAFLGEAVSRYFGEAAEEPRGQIKERRGNSYVAECQHFVS